MTAQKMFRPRVLQILPWLGTAGAEHMAANLALGLVDSYDVASVGLYPPMKSTTEQAMSAAGIPLGWLDKRPGFDWRMFGGVDRVLRDFRPDIVHSHLYALRYTLPACIWRRIPVLVHTVHNLAERECDAAGRFIHRLAFRKRVVPVAVSRSVAASLERAYGIRDAVTIPNGIPARRFGADPSARAKLRQELGLGGRDFVFISTGRLTEQKNPLLLLRAFSALAGSPAHLVMVGQGPLGERVEQEVGAAGLGDRVHLLGYRSDIPECLAGADAFVLSSDWEGHPLGVMEAMASGLPVIATSVGGVPEVVESGAHGLLVPAGDAEALAGAMRFLLDRPHLRAAMGEAARKRARAEFSVETMVGAYDFLYRSRLSAATGGSIRLVRTAVEGGLVL
jgi:glycosyltransferase involved in cell wall biosynthesis